MEEAKAAAYYEDLTRRGEGAARFKQGLGFSSGNSDSENAPVRGSALSSSSSSSSSPFMSRFVKASSPSKTTSEIDKQLQIQSIQNKLKRRKPEGEEEEEEQRPRVRVSERDRDRRSRERRSSHRSRSRSRERRSSHRSRSRSRERHRDKDRRPRWSMSGSESDGDRRRRRRSRSPRNRRTERRRSRSLSPPPLPRERGVEKSRGKLEKEKNGGVDYSKLIQGYDRMSAAERVKAKMKLQLAETAEKDTTLGKDGWERFEFNKEALLDDEEVEVAEDDAALVTHIGKSFRFSAFETKKEDQIKTAHDEAMFGSSDNPPTIVMDRDVEAESDAEARNDDKVRKESEPPSLLNEKVLAKSQGSWRDHTPKQIVTMMDSSVAVMVS